VVFLPVKDSHNTEANASALMKKYLAKYVPSMAKSKVFTISPTGHTDHKAAYAAVMNSLAPYNRTVTIAWGYDDKGIAISEPTTGTPVVPVGSIPKKNKHITAYKTFFMRYYPRKSIALFTTHLNKPDVLSSVTATRVVSPILPLAD
jgi:hypothetical protein